jgi:hypothetical protein
MYLKCLNRFQSKMFKIKKIAIRANVLRKTKIGAKQLIGKD